MPQRSDTRQRMVRSTVELLRERGATATTIDRVLADSGAPRGSVYHHFPGGRSQLVREAVATATVPMVTAIESAAENDNVVEAVEGLFAGWRVGVVEGDYRSGCPIVAAAVETNDDAPEIAESAGTAFGQWCDALAKLLQNFGISVERSRVLAFTIIGAQEGALVLSRAMRSTEPLDAVRDEISKLLANAVGETENVPEHHGDDKSE
ncbi:TetR/AcrR family transcriptional regulator [Cumulibacter soli]|uniref:TetR/AcrR family transcriptional regulator n=1 Tax=Cumulibacter soli TaxID=2546344 RepID=UPI001ABAF6C1|nr:TetR/AcrR family transcriptional regulator [Cumulibacter soli]